MQEAMWGISHARPEFESAFRRPVGADGADLQHPGRAQSASLVWHLRSDHGQSANKAFTVSLFPSLGAPLTRIAAWITFAAEFATGVALLFGAWKMWAARAGDRPAFAASTHYARLGAGLAVFTWFGLFGVGGGAAWQMWQHTVGSGALENAFQFSVWGFLLLIWLSAGERETA